MILDIILSSINYLFGLLHVPNWDFSPFGSLLGDFFGYCSVGVQWVLYLSFKPLVLICLGIISSYYIFKGGAFIVKLAIKIFT